MTALNLEYIFFKIYYFLSDWASFILSVITNEWYVLLIKLAWGVFGLLATGLLAYYVFKLQALIKGERLDYQQMLWNSWQQQSEKEGNENWIRIERSLESDNQADWKVAIMDADVMLDSMISAMGYAGENLGERMKSIEPSDFLTLNDAWEAHKVRNIIAHEGGYDLSKREASRVIGLYEKVFREFNYI